MVVLTAVGAGSDRSVAEERATGRLAVNYINPMGPAMVPARERRASPAGMATTARRAVMRACGDADVP